MEPSRETQKGLSPQVEFFLARGMDSFTDPTFVGARQYRAGFNVVNRAGLVQCRPGYRPLVTLPAGRLQGAKLFTPTGGKAHLVFAVEGKVYASKAPFTSYFQIPELNFRPGVRNIYFEIGQKAVVRNTASGELTVCDPYKVLVVQDGNYTRAGFWDGANAGHLDPSNTGKKQTVGGGIMKWSGDRLWVARGPQLFASDIADPLSFDESDYLAEGQPLLFPSDITAMVEVPSATAPCLLVFTEDEGFVVRSDIRDRSTWKTTANFQARFTPVGCVGHRAVATQFGLVWWYTPGGLISLDSGAVSNVSSQLHYKDVEMAISKANVRAYQHRIALAAVENFLLVSVPSGDGYNRHTWVLDQSAGDLSESELGAAWAGIWTGTRPVEWCTGSVEGRLRAFYVSKDYDGQNRLWEAFQPEQTDGGRAIEWSLITKAHAETVGLSRFRYAEVYVAQVRGAVSLAIDYAGPYRGAWKNLLSGQVRAAVGGLSAGETVSAADPLTSLRPQVRTVRTPESDANVGDSTPEGIWAENIDFSHQLRISGVGPAAVRGYKIYTKPEPESASGAPFESETVAHAVGIDGAIIEGAGSLTATTAASGGPFLVSALELRGEDSDYHSV